MCQGHTLLRDREWVLRRTCTDIALAIFSTAAAIVAFDITIATSSTACLAHKATAPGQRLRTR